MDSKITLRLETVTPLLMSGANKEPELRAASFRGVLRYWMRALLGAQSDNPQELFEDKKLFNEENKYFGSTKGGSPIRVRMGAVSEAQKFSSQNVLPPYQSFTGYKKGFTFDLIFDIHPLCNAENIFDEQFWMSLLLAFNFGAFGKRSRRGGGALRVKKITLENFSAKAEGISENYRWLLEKAPANYDQLKDQLESIVKLVSSAGKWSSTPDYPIFHAKHVQVFLSNTGNKLYLEALKEPAWRVSGEAKYHHAKGAWGHSTSRQRRASAFHIRVHHCADGNYYPLVTVFHSGNDWNTVGNYYHMLTSAGFDCIHGPKKDFK